MTPSDLVSRLAGRRIAVAGDLIVDHFLYGRVDRISPEAPVPIVRFDREEFRLGGAANVAHNIRTLGGEARLIGLVGRDDGAGQLQEQLRAAGIDAAGLVTDPARLTTRKLRVVTSRNQQVARVDYERDGDASGAVLDALRDRLSSAAASAHAIVLSDYGKGVVTPAIIAAAVAAAGAAKIPLIIDPKLPQAARYAGATLLTPNHREAELMTQLPIRTNEDARTAARLLHEKTGASILITWGEHGMWVMDAAAPARVEEALPAITHEVADVTGAGDTVAAVLALALSAGARLGDAARLANLAASIVVTRFGPATVSAAELRALTETSN